LRSCPIEKAEQLEQLRWLYNGSLHVHETQKEVIGIDLPEHLAIAKCPLKKSFPCPRLITYWSRDSSLLAAYSSQAFTPSYAVCKNHFFRI